MIDLNERKRKGGCNDAIVTSIEIDTRDTRFLFFVCHCQLRPAFLSAQSREKERDR